jgi:hypothetical protein
MSSNLHGTSAVDSISHQPMNEKHTPAQNVYLIESHKTLQTFNQTLSQSEWEPQVVGAKLVGSARQIQIIWSTLTLLSFFVV